MHLRDGELRYIGGNRDHPLNLFPQNHLWWDVFTLASACAAAAIQYAGLVAERWFFFAAARHPQNLDHQR
ncbi:hypothetical protein F4827_003920 [Paraburkholderia bannensis]|uniref:Uncharacterized protein n=1 Tax=Paraburkholderia bannensis TaxID=765414 RepID=A0A7W9U0K8_9BURK|nr:hypothetical protein [Paraburkholderia sp. WP4_3_2]MBB6104061.1 hypothetical protein [Paraburkholderia bannensis]